MTDNSGIGYVEVEDTSQRMGDFLVSDYILNGEKAPLRVKNVKVPRSPVLVFVNVRSGGQLGSKILPHLRALLNPKQVHELPAEKPDEVLHNFLSHLESLIEDGDEVAADTRSRLRLVVAGGDGTHGWVLGAVADLKLRSLPPIATIPLGTGNNLPFSFGWGKDNPSPNIESVRDFLEKTIQANPMPVDRWHVVIHMSKPVEDSPLQEVAQQTCSSRLLNQLPSFSRVANTNQYFQDGRHSYEGGFWNYLSIGLDAEVSYEFHKKRQENPDLFKHQTMNQISYACITVKKGGFAPPCLQPKSGNIDTVTNIFVAKFDGNWQKLSIPPKIRSIVLLNLPSFSGGLNPWGTPDDKKSKEKGFIAPYVDDGLIEIVGFRDAWEGILLLSPKGHGTRLAQSHRVKIEFHEGDANHTFMRVDGEPWMQALPPNTEPTVMEISHKGQAVVLSLGDCCAKPIPADIATQIHRQISVASVDSAQHTVGSNPRN